MALTLTELRQWYEQHIDAIVQDYFTFLRFKSISTDPSYSRDVHGAAEWLCDYLNQIGMDAELWKTSGHPCVFASHLKAGSARPTLLIYHHYDVQPVDPLELWKSPPFDPVIRDDQVFARGASDNKGQCFYSITALKAVLSKAKKLDVNIKLFIEGEEESGGEGTVTLLPKKQKELKADYLLVVDADLPKEGEPGITLGTRGILAMEVCLQNSEIDLHSGTHGGIALNPNRELIHVLSQLWDERGKVAIPGFYEGIKDISDQEKSKYYLEFDEQAYRRTFGVAALANEQGYTPMEANTIRPTLEINGISGGYTGLGFKTVIPAVSRAKISCRLVPGQDPDSIFKNFENFIYEHAARGIKTEVVCLHKAPAFRCSKDSEIVHIAAKAYEEMFQKPCRYVLSGGSIPIVDDLKKASGAEALIMGFALAEDDIHAPNEHFGLDRFEMGFLTMARIIAMISEKK